MRFRKDPGRPGPVGALAECFGGTAGPVDGRRSGLDDAARVPHRPDRGRLPQGVRRRAGARRRLEYLRERTRQCFSGFPVPDWRTLHAALTHGHVAAALTVAESPGRSPPQRGAPGCA